MHRWISQNNIRLPCGAFFISVLFFQRCMYSKR
ncbi:hypothetical protein CO278_002095 [Escherichia coli]|nr:hypothetical protein [Escherichia coli]EFG8288155.1 hypothetical protein [Escherichia coli]